MQETCYKIPIIRILIEVQLIYNDALISVVQQNDSVIDIYNVYIFQILLQYKLLQDIEYSSL